MASVDGWTGVILRVNLARPEVSQEVLGKDELRKYVGGRGLAGHLLAKGVDPTIDALSPANKMVFANGPLTGTIAPGNGRCVVVSKSALNNGIACANIGGFWAAELKSAGYDALIVEGKASEPTYLWVGDKGVELRSAAHLWGKGTRQGASEIRKETVDDAAIISIGQAGERLARIASLVEANKRWSSGRAGLGAVMGSKNLKAIAIKGSGSIRVADRQGFEKMVKELNSRIASETLLSQHIAYWGTASIVKLLHSQGALPVCNFQGASALPQAGLPSEYIASSIFKRRTSCFACPVACGRVSQVLQATGEGPELEDIMALGSNLGITDISAVAMASYLCEDFGLDPVAAGSAIACAMEMQDKGVLDVARVGTSFSFGDSSGVANILNLMASRHGVGELMAEGGYQLAKQYGVPEFFMGVKKQAFSAYDPSKDEWLALSYTTSNTGAASAVDGKLIRATLRSLNRHPGNEADEVERIKIRQDLSVAMECAGICPLIAAALDANEVASLVGAATGIDFSTADLLAAGERTWDSERIFNLGAGFTALDDQLPGRFRQLTNGDLVQEYYRIRGWDSSGRPGAQV